VSCGRRGSGRVYFAEKLAEGGVAEGDGFVGAELKHGDGVGCREVYA